MSFAQAYTDTVALLQTAIANQYGQDPEATDRLLQVFDKLSKVRQSDPSSSPGGTAPPSASEILLADIKAATLSLVPLIDGLELITGNIKIDTASINLDTAPIDSALDDINTLIADLNSAIATTNSLTTAQAADVALMRPALVSIKATIEQFQSDTDAQLTQIQTVLGNMLTLLTQIYGAIGTIDTNVSVLVNRSAPLVFEATDRQEPGSGNYLLAADPDRRGIWILNNTGEQNGRGASTLFIRHDGTPDRFDHQQWVLPGEGAWVNSPELALEIYAESITGSSNGAYTITRYL